MICLQCGHDVATESAACLNCGAPLAGNAGQSAAAPPGSYAAQPPGPSAAPAGHAAPAGPAAALRPAAPAGPAAALSEAFAFDANRLSRDDKIVGGATLLLLISLFLPWYTVTAPTATINGVTVSGGESFSADAVGGHSWVWIVFILGLSVLAYLVMQAGFETAPVRLPFSPVQTLLGLTGINLLLVLLAFLAKPGTGETLIKVSIGWGIGAFLGLICAIAAFAPVGLPFARARTGR